MTQYTTDGAPFDLWIHADRGVRVYPPGEAGPDADPGFYHFALVWDRETDIEMDDDLRGRFDSVEALAAAVAEESDLAPGPWLDRLVARARRAPRVETATTSTRFEDLPELTVATQWRAVDDSVDPPWRGPVRTLRGRAESDARRRARGPAPLAHRVTLALAESVAARAAGPAGAAAEENRQRAATLFEDLRARVADEVVDREVLRDRGAACEGGDRPPASAAATLRRLRELDLDAHAREATSVPLAGNSFHRVRVGEGTNGAIGISISPWPVSDGVGAIVAAFLLARAEAIALAAALVAGRGTLTLTSSEHGRLVIDLEGPEPVRWVSPEGEVIYYLEDAPRAARWLERAVGARPTVSRALSRFAIEGGR